MKILARAAAVLVPATAVVALGMSGASAAPADPRPGFVQPVTICELKDTAFAYTQVKGCASVGTGG